MKLTMALLTPLLAALAYLLLIPWDLRNRPSSPGALEETTPVNTLAVIGLVAVLALLAAALTWQGWAPWWAAPLVAGPPAVLLLISYATHRSADANPWPLAWIFFTVLMAGGAVAVAALARLVIK